MALIAAVATGVWSSGAIWDGGSVPASGDTVESASFTVTIDQNITCVAITNVSGGGFTVPNTLSGTRTITGTHTLFGASGATAPTIPGGSFVVVRVTPNNAAAATMQWYGVVDGANLIVGTSADMGEVSGDAITVTPSAFSGLHFWITGSAGTPWVAGDVGKWIRVFQGATVRGTWRIEELGDAGGGAGSKIKVYGQAVPTDWTGGETYYNLTAYLLSVEVAFTNQDRDIVPDGVTVRFPQVLT